MSILSVWFLAFVLLLIFLYYILPKAFSPYIILFGSIAFYLCFDLRCSLYLLFSVLTVFIGAILINSYSAKGIKKLILSIVLILNIGLLFFVKFTPYIVSKLDGILNLQQSSFSVLVPVGISFYTLQVCGYCIDVYRGKYAPQKNVFKFAAFATFFPLILQGPISRYDQLSTTLFAHRKREDFYENLTSGAQIMLWGFFKKLVIADRAAMVANAVFDNYEAYSGFAVIFAVLCYTIQIYTDFSGCVDICRGTAKTFGINVIDNFRQPYFSNSIRDFWTRWHIALSSWFKDYIYIPLGGNRKGKIRKHINTLIVFFISGLWHGVGVHYIVWGLLQGIYQIIGALTLSLRTKLCSGLHINRNSTGYIWFQRLFTFVLVNISWVFFRANGTMAAFKMLASATVFIPGKEIFPQLDHADLAVLAIASIVLLIVSFYREKGISVRLKVANSVLPVRWSVYLLLFVVVLIFGIYGPGYSDAAFIYMNF